MLVDERISVKRVLYASSAEDPRRCGMIRATTKQRCGGEGSGNVSEQ